jgi:hypothetical protein
VAGSACHCSLCQPVLRAGQITSAGAIRVGVCMCASAANTQGCVCGRAEVSGAASHLLEPASAVQRLHDVESEVRCPLRRQ